MAEDLRLERPAQQEEVAEGRVAHASDGEAQAALHELRHARLQDGPPRVVVHIGQHGLQLVRCVQHRVVVVIIEQRLLVAREGGVVARALRVGHGAEGAAVFCWCPRHRWRARQLMPTPGTCHLEPAYHLPHAHDHALLNKEDAVEMVGHGHLAKDAEVTAVEKLGIGDLLPLFLHRPPQRGEVHGGVDGVHIEGAEEGIAVGDDDGDEVDAALVVVVALVTRTVGWVLWDGSIVGHGK